MFTGNPDKSWERYGKSDPYFGVWLHEKYKTENLNEEALEEFFRSGEEHVRTIIEIVREHLDGAFYPTRALDFGCGVGRLTIPLAKICSYVVGVDVSDSMLDEARKNCLRNKVLSKVDLVKSDDKLSRVSGTFDFVVSHITLQHIPRKRGEAILEALIDHLDTKGTGVLHFTFFRKASKIEVRRVGQWARRYIPLAHNLANLIQKKPVFTPLMQWNTYNLNNIFLMLREKGCNHSYVRFTEDGGMVGVVLFFQKKTLPIGT